MFGYVRPPLAELPEEETIRFRKVYCGLCHTLRQRYGQAARCILNYDFTFLAILLSEPQCDASHAARCLLRKRDVLDITPALELAADESVILTYWKMQDGIADHKGLRRAGDQVAAGILEAAYRKAAQLRPEFDMRVREQLMLLRRLEEEHCSSIDRSADAFAQLLAAAAGEVTDPVRSRVLEQMLYHLGRWIYLVDAADDLKEDAAAGNYNPVALRYDLQAGSWTADSRRLFTTTLDHSIRMMTTAFELWDFGVWTPIISATLYSGLFQVGKAVLDGERKQKVGTK